MAKPSPIVKLVRLSCHHERAYNSPYPEIGEPVLCPRCGRYRVVMTVAAEYRVKCRDCNTSHGYGVAKLTAQHAASKHTRMHAGHRTLLFLGKELLSESAGRQGSLEEELDFPPF